MPELQLNLYVGLAILSAVGGVVGYLVRPLIAINGELRTEVARLQVQNDHLEHRVATLEELVTQRAAVDELAGYMADWRDEARQRDELIIRSLNSIASHFEGGTTA